MQCTTLHSRFLQEKVKMFAWVAKWNDGSIVFSSICSKFKENIRYVTPRIVSIFGYVRYLGCLPLMCRDNSASAFNTGGVGAGLNISSCRSEVNEDWYACAS